MSADTNVSECAQIKTDACIVIIQTRAHTHWQVRAHGAGVAHLERAALDARHEQGVKGQRVCRHVLRHHALKDAPGQVPLPMAGTHAQDGVVGARSVMQANGLRAQQWCRGASERERKCAGFLAFWYSGTGAPLWPGGKQGRGRVISGCCAAIYGGGSAAAQAGQHRVGHVGVGGAVRENACRTPCGLEDILACACGG